MNKEELTMISFEIVSYAGDARSKLLLALEKAKQGLFEECDALIAAANECLVSAHNAQMDVMQAEANGQDVEMGFIMVHAQDHLMTSLLFKDIIGSLIDVYRK
ncbi:MAG: PTS lactose/cellobiose transporter subunit IIA [Anaerostipes sp.]|uniref:PTS lactose/cellobiose transporter subunit IIA n=1 Tax=Anaerostipes sp. 992a TaxID=1261637 RepID=UPI0009531C7D|nr:PTS lactose/cellobiose transporter subunit IIA [Anaerostipes sp. 992a]MCI5951178.1 PTS lactose/cellobiose transporter subunit IIA [Anaerostipes sp.]MDD5967960.1 PTS lactose/cellobiose transporter subunit IIA [Anaerostipes sp.]OLR64028.1 PTS lactose transporter subunit IIA [Anaerostipes sp. 992a]